MTCDGCVQPLNPVKTHFIRDYGHEVRYCDDCAETYERFRTAVMAEEARRQRELDLWQLTARTMCPLLTMPMDFPPLKIEKTPEGVLRLG